MSVSAEIIATMLMDHEAAEEETSLFFTVSIKDRDGFWRTYRLCHYCLCPSARHNGTFCPGHQTRCSDPFHFRDHEE